MNVLILTPDAVGSTLLQRLITIYMQFNNYDRPVINLHELTNGLVRYYNTTLDQEVLGKKDGSWGYHQSLEEIATLLASVDHYKTSRLAHYHIKNRQDSLQDQIQFYQYLNDNFYIISCRRHNVFEHALSWCLRKITKKFNVYTGNEKISSFFDFYKQGVDIDPNSLIQTLNAYRDYLHWCNNHFNVANYFFYDEHLPNIEKYILSLPIFPQLTKLTWADKFDIDFDTWNRCHFINSDIGTLALDSPEIFAQLTNNAMPTSTADNEIQFLSSYKDVADPSWNSLSSLEDYETLPDRIKKEITEQFGLSLKGTSLDLTSSTPSLASLLPTQHQEFICRHQKTYQNSIVELNDMVKSGIMITPPPIKKQTLQEKKHMIRNFSHLLDVYNEWIANNSDIGQPLSESTLHQFATRERTQWNPTGTDIVVTAQQKPD